MGAVGWVWGMGYGVWGIGYGVWRMGYGVWGMAYGVWRMGYGVWGVGGSISDGQTAYFIIGVSQQIEVEPI